MQIRTYNAQARAFATAFVFLLAGACQSEEGTSICELVSRGAKADGAKVKVAALYSTDLQHSAGFTDVSCPQVYLERTMARERPKNRDKSVETFDQLVRGDPLDLNERLFEVEVEGTFYWIDNPAGSAERIDGLPTQKAWIAIERVISYRRIEKQ